MNRNSFHKIPVILGELVQKHRHGKNMSQSNLALTAGMNVSYLSTVECGYSYISIVKYLDLCEALEVSPVYLMNELVEEIERYDNLNNL